MRDEEELKITVGRTFDKSKAWDNPNLHIPIEKAHLSMVGEGDPQFYEQLCVKHDTILPKSATTNAAGAGT